MTNKLNSNKIYEKYLKIYQKTSKPYPKCSPGAPKRPTGAKIGPNVRFKKARAGFFGAGTCSPESTCQFFPLGRMLVTPSDARRRSKNNAKSDQKQQPRRFLFYAKNTMFHWFKRTWGAKGGTRATKKASQTAKNWSQGFPQDTFLSLFLMSQTNVS